MAQSRGQSLLQLAADQAASLPRLANGLRDAFEAALCCARALELQHTAPQVRVLAELKGGLTAMPEPGSKVHFATSPIVKPGFVPRGGKNDI